MDNSHLLLSRRLVREFCTYCNWAYYCYQMHASLFDKAAEEQLQGSAAGAGLGRLSLLSHGAMLLELAKLHDPPASGRDVTLGIDFVVRFGGWKTSTQEQLDQVRDELFAFYEARNQGTRGKPATGVRAARNRTICHNDLAALAHGEPLGGFKETEGARYWENLQKLVNLMWNEVDGSDFPFDTLGGHEGAAVLRAVMSGDTEERAKEALPR